MVTIRHFHDRRYAIWSAPGLSGLLQTNIQLATRPLFETSQVSKMRAHPAHSMNTIALRPHRQVIPNR